MYNSRASWILLGFRVSFNFSNNISAPFSPANSVVEINWAILSADPDKPSTNLKPSGPSFFCSSSGRSASRVPRALTRQQYSASFCASPPNRGKPPPFDSVLVTASSAWMKFAYRKLSSRAMKLCCNGASSATSKRVGFQKPRSLVAPLPVWKQLPHWQQPGCTFCSQMLEPRYVADCSLENLYM